MATSASFTRILRRNALHMAAASASPDSMAANPKAVSAPAAASVGVSSVTLAVPPSTHMFLMPSDAQDWSPAWTIGSCWVFPSASSDATTLAAVCGMGSAAVIFCITRFTKATKSFFSTSRRRQYWPLTRMALMGGSGVRGEPAETGGGRW